ncbi:MAG TPA: DegQ family serine endoprotease [Candidatus Acidoferrum sp.]|jgi:serine protease Do|nr:DegQ family serine endoprotease [Candidatus Acidoferrum sp.]
MSGQKISGKWLAGALGLALAFGVGGYAVARAKDGVSTTHVRASLKLADPSEGPSKTGFAPIVKEVLPNVVNISSSKVVKTKNQMQLPEGMEQDPFFQQFFGQQFGGRGRGGNGPDMPQKQREQSLGSGVIVSPEGYVLTNNHVVDGATDVKVTLSDKREFKATVVGTDPKTDIAVLKLTGEKFNPITLGDSQKVQVGDYALAIGDPFGVGQTVTMGIVSAKGRGNLGIEDYEDFIQTDAPINPGNSGGALVNDRGELVGINTAILSHGSGGNEGIGFAIPINLARNVMGQIIDHGKVTRGYLGVVIQQITPNMSKALNLDKMQGAIVSDVSAKGPAKDAGVQRGDVILAINGNTVADSNDLRNTISMMQPGQTVKLTINRNGSTKDIDVKLGELPLSKDEAESQSDNSSSKESMKGISVETLDSDTAQQLQLPEATKGVVVTGVDPSSAAADSGLRKGDVIQEVNHQPVKTAAEFEAAMSKSDKNGVLLLVNRGGTTIFVAL